MPADESSDDERSSDEPSDDEPAGALGFPVVGIGASAGGLGAFTAFLEHLPEGSGMAFVLVQHLDPDHESELPGLLQRATAMTVRHVEEDGGMALEANHVYVIPPARDLRLSGGELHLSEMDPDRADREPIDHFFRSLAESQGAGAIGVVLSGTGSGGTAGLRHIKERGGLTLAQAPEEAEFEGMPESAARRGVVDVVAPAAELAEKLVQFVEARARLQLPEDGDDLNGTDEETLAGIFETLRERAGHDFSQYKRSTVLRRIGRRMQVHQISELPAYLDFLREDSGETQALFRDLLITVTRFFRDPEAFEALGETVLPALFEGKGPDDTVRVWATGCSTGEEAYSLAILLHEYADTLDSPAPALQVFATDLSEKTIATAREGFYPENVAADLSEERLERHFEREAGGYRVRKRLRETVIFARHNLMNDPPFSRLDLVACRNLLIYLKREVQRRVFDVFHYALRPGGYLFLGSAESAAEAKALFRLADKAHRLYRRRDDAVRTPRFDDMPFLRQPGRRSLPGAGDEASTDEPPARAAPTLDEVRLGLLEGYAPPGLLVSAENEVAHIFDHGGRYLRLTQGTPTYDVLEMIRPALRAALRTALFQARSEEQEARSRAVPVEIDEQARQVRCVARPAPGASGFVQVVFEHKGEEGAPEAAPGTAARDAAADGSPPRDADAAPPGAEAPDAETHEAEQLEEELGAVRRELRATVEEYESAMEEQRASNEELQSMNEELRSTTEELETSKEELQSMNEELTTVNQELTSKNEQLGEVNSDLQNLFSATQIATLFLDRDLRIRRYTPRAEELFNIIETDRGRSVEHVTRRFDHTDFAEKARQVIADLRPIEREVENEDGQWFLMRIRPYRTAREDRIDGVVVTFVEITERKDTREALRRAKKYAEHIVDTVREPLLVLDADLRVQSANSSFYDTFEATPAATEGTLIYELGNRQWDLPELRHLLGEVLPENDTFEGLAVEHDFEGLGRRHMVLNARRLQQHDLILLAIEDQTEQRRRAAEALRKSEERFRRLVDASAQMVWQTDAEGQVVEDSPSWRAYTGMTLEEWKGEGWANAVHPDDREYALENWRESVETETPVNTEFRVYHAPSEDWRWTSVRAVPLRSDEGEVRGWIGMSIDVDERRRAEERVRRLVHDLTEAEDRERRRIATVLHEDLQQQLYGAEMTARRARRLAESHAAEDDDADDDAEDSAESSTAEIIALCERMDGILGDAVETTRTLSSELSPTVLSEENLALALAWLAGHMQERHGLQVETGVQEELVVASRPRRTLLLRLARELLFNVVKHAETERAALGARAEDGELLLHVADEGVGFDPAAIEAQPGGYGLSNMRERLHFLGGRLELESAPGEGTRVTLALPEDAGQDAGRPASRRATAFVKP